MPKLRQQYQIKESSSYIDGSFESSPSNLLDDLSNLRYQIRSLIGGSDWDDDIRGSYSLADHSSRHESGGADVINHDDLTGFVLNEHIDWTSTSSNFLTTGTVNGGDATFLRGQFTGNFYAKSTTVSNYISIDDSAGIKEMTLKHLVAPVDSNDAARKQDIDDIDHDSLTGFVANEHIDWTSTSENFSTTGSINAGNASFNSGIFDISSLSFLVQGSAVEDYINISDTSEELVLNYLPDTPPNNHSAVNKNYVDSAIGQSGRTVIPYGANTVSISLSPSIVGFKAIASISYDSANEPEVYACTVYNKKGDGSGFDIMLSGNVPSSGSRYYVEWAVFA